ncbi:MAG: secretin N-terminal domain-containing protein [Proteobacteria bacterium]|nr:secretin N-terminal domain-containing protein [Pseudomonadota bacterium]
MTLKKTAYICGLIAALTCFLAGCSASLPERPTPGRHITPGPPPAQSPIPEVVRTPSLLAPLAPEAKHDVYSVVVHDVPAKDLLFALARDASLNIDVHPDISGNVTLNAIDQTLPQILTRIARQVDIRWNLVPPNLIVEPDAPILRTYRIDYVNIARKSAGEVNVATSISTTGSSGSGGGSGTGGGDNNSTTRLSQESNNMFWATLVANLRSILGDNGGGASPSSGEAPAAGGATSAVAGPGASNVIISNPESGLILVRGTVRQHEEVRRFLDLMHLRVLQQVLIEATVVEVRLKNQYQAGIDWATLGRDSGSYSFVQSLTGINLASAPLSTMTIDHSTGPDALTATIKLLEQFGDLKVLSSPKVMVLNNQTAMLKVVDNKVYFTIEVTAGTAATATAPATPPTYTSTVHTVPVGFVMAVTPQISESEQVTLNIRPTISRIIGYVNDPNPALAENNITNRVPEVQVREVESILKMNSGQIGVLGGLMQDSLDKSTAGLPGLSHLPLVGNLFSYRDDTANKTELVIFLRPAVIRQASLDADLKQFRDHLPTTQPVPSVSESTWRLFNGEPE